MATRTLSEQERAELARAVLAHAELRTGARSARIGLRSVEPPTPGAGRAAAATVPATVPVPVSVPVRDRGATAPLLGTAAGGTVAHPDLAAPAEADGPVEPRRHGVLTAERPPLPVPARLAPLLPDGLRRGATTAVVGSTSLVLAMLAHACAGGAWAAVVGQPTVGLLAAAQAGVALDRLAVVPRPGADAATVVAALVDGIDVVLVGPDAVLTDTDRRRLSARARDRGAVLLSTVPWPGAATVLVVEAGRWTGVGTGDGRLRTHELRVTRTGRGGAAVPLSVDLTLPLTAEPAGAERAGAAAARREAAAQRPGAPDLRLVG
ncbi:hypothetical protein [Cellulomonas fimi]|uniref:Uncharacterized protein n=1 Tax=Cellulomonas fimi (strain ATCC 484 / DSM 20113 / JCM 1341 / CCUG 24087 / LMG 16345 / NBRC 15513 / NCIMB 8980 / NCTC 7547 / NRS-133) TaxID=590998 RepID=F4H8I7_CELFA|nr:hypothetical protein [Cellulomonas fimi]AEE45868.1 hypothetical protein Celf_1736 [Cellulomonas fimi ATCC 484]NNH09240.1 hypothetical protein [Cellulomonas fimi]VEH30839.1 Uncharacterised protein [Cellulomonas fimi]